MNCGAVLSSALVQHNLSQSSAGHRALVSYGALHPSTISQHFFSARYCTTAPKSSHKPRPISPETACYSSVKLLSS